MYPRGLPAEAPAPAPEHLLFARAERPPFPQSLQDPKMVGQRSLPPQGRPIKYVTPCRCG
eukprot:7074012-Pyramimonas_sp.AAC.1